MIQFEANKVYTGKMETILPNFPSNIFDSCVTDPPYGISFMNNHWDYEIPSVEQWKEVYRVLKPGAHLLAACGTRTQHRMAVNIEVAGFEIRDVITWHYGSGFPKSMDISLQIDNHFGKERKITKERTADERISGDFDHATSSDRQQRKIPITDEAKEWEGWGTGLKPATEFFTLARKPISEKTVAANVLKHNTGGLNINDTRISFKGEDDLKSAIYSTGIDIKGGQFGSGSNAIKTDDERIEPNPKGRFPSNLILSHHPDCEYIGIKKVKAITGGSGEASTGGMGKNGKYGKYANNQVGDNAGGVGDEDGMETVESWKCVEGCPIREIDLQKPNAGAYAPVKEQRKQNGSVYNEYEYSVANTRIDEGGASRFFYCPKPDTFEREKGLKNFELKPVAASNQAIAELKRGNDDFKRENKNVSGFSNVQKKRNTHSTVKPIDLMRYLVRLITPKGGVVLDPFGGSGTTGIGCKLELMQYVIIEENEYDCHIAEARIVAWNPERYIPQTLF